MEIKDPMTYLSAEELKPYTVWIFGRKKGAERFIFCRDFEAESEAKACAEQLAATLHFLGAKWAVSCDVWHRDTRLVGHGVCGFQFTTGYRVRAMLRRAKDKLSWGKGRSKNA